MFFVVVFKVKSRSFILNSNNNNNKKKKNVYLIPTSIINVIRFSYQTNCLKKKKLNKNFEAGLKFSLIYFLNNKMLNFYL